MRFLRLENEFSRFFLCGQLYRLEDTKRNAFGLTEFQNQVHYRKFLREYLYSFWKQPASSFLRKNNYCFPGQGNLGHHTNIVTANGIDLFIKYLLRLLLCGFLLPRKHLLLTFRTALTLKVISGFSFPFVI